MPTQFGAELARRRQLHRLSRPKLAGLAGISDAQIRNLELHDVTPQRTTVIDLASALKGWDVDDALRLAGYEALSDDERAHLAPPAARDPWDIVQRAWPNLTPPQQWALAYLVQVNEDPRSWPSDNPRSTADHVPVPGVWQQNWRFSELEPKREPEAGPAALDGD